MTAVMANVQKVIDTVKDSQKLKTWVGEHKTSVKAWTAFILGVFVLFWMCSDGDFSFLLTLSSLISMFAFAMVLMKIEKTKTVSGVSCRMYECYVALIAARLCSILPFEGYVIAPYRTIYIFLGTSLMIALVIGCINWLNALL